MDGDYVALNGVLRLWGLLKTVKDDAMMLYYAWKHPGTPAVVKGMLVALVTYVISPIDVIPDYLPFIGIADDVMLIPAAVLFLTNMLPPSVRNECELESFKWRKRMPWLFGVFVIFIIMWLVIAIVGLGHVISFIRTG